MCPSTEALLLTFRRAMICASEHFSWWNYFLFKMKQIIFPLMNHDLYLVMASICPTWHFIWLPQTSHTKGKIRCLILVIYFSFSRPNEVTIATVSIKLKYASYNAVSPGKWRVHFMQTNKRFPCDLSQSYTGMHSVYKWYKCSLRVFVF